MKRFIFCIVGAAIAAAAADVAALAAPADPDKTEAARAASDWSQGGRWLTPYEIPGYSGGYAVSWPAARQTAQAPQGDAVTHPAADPVK